MHSLNELQQKMHAYILGQRDQVLEWVESNSASVRMDVYADGYYLRLLEILEKDYPKLLKWLGDEHFDGLGRRYIDTYPSKSYSIDSFGKKMAEFLVQQDLPVHAEMAQFEWALSEAITVANTPILEQQDLLSVPQEQWPEIYIKPHATLQILSLNWNIPAVWQAMDKGLEIPTLLREEVTKTWLVWRKADQIAYFCPLTPIEMKVLQALVEGQAFWQVCEGLLPWLKEEEVAPFVVNLLIRWLNDQLLSEISS